MNNSNPFKQPAIVRMGDACYQKKDKYVCPVQVMLVVDIFDNFVICAFQSEKGIIELPYRIANLTKCHHQTWVHKDKLGKYIK